MKPGCALLTLALSLCSVAPAVAQSASQTSPQTASTTASDDRASREDVLRMFDALHVRQQMQTTFAAMTDSMSAQVEESLKQNPQLSDADRKQLAKMVGDVQAIYPPDEMLDDLVPIYQKHLTRSDIHAVIEFYDSPAGQHLLAETPAITQDAIGVIVKKMNDRMTAYVAKAIQKAHPQNGDDTRK